MPDGNVIGVERIVVSPSRSLVPADEPAASPVTNAARPDGVDDGWSVLPPLVVPDGLPRAKRSDAGAVSVPSGLTVQPRPTSKSSSSAPQCTCRTEAPRMDSGHHARSASHRTASLLRPVSGAMNDVLG